MANVISEVDFALGGQGPGYGKNYHTVNPEPFTWENLSQIEYFVAAMPDGKFLAGVSLAGSDDSSHTYQFNSEAEAMQWVKNASERFTVHRANQEL